MVNNSERIIQGAFTAVNNILFYVVGYDLIKNAKVSDEQALIEMLDVNEESIKPETTLL